MTSWHVEGVGDIAIESRWIGFTLIDIAGYLSITPAEARPLALTLLEAAASTCGPHPSHYVITGIYPAYTVTDNGEYLDQTTELAPLMNMLRDRLNPGDTITWAEQPQGAAE